MANSRQKKSPLHGIFRSLGPGLITACVVIGPGSILTSSKVGATYGFQLAWVLVIAVVLMLTYMTMGARLGVVADRSPGDLLRDKTGAWLPALIGISVFCISSSYQFGNNLGASSAFDVYLPEMNGAWRLTILISLLAVFNGLAIAFLFIFKDLYRWLEIVMSGFVFVMLGAFLLNLLLVGLDIPAVLRGFVPRLPDTRGGTEDLLAIVGWIGTTFITAIAYYQSYLVRMKGWTEANLGQGLRDAGVGSLVLASITFMIMCTAATQLQGKQLGSVGDVAQQLGELRIPGLFDGAGQLIFCIGLFCAAYSSFLINSMIGGFLLADGLKLGSTPDHRAPRVFAATILIIGFAIASICLVFEVKPVPAIVFAQAITVLAAPLIGVVLWWLTSNRQIMGDKALGPIGHVGAGAGILVLLALSVYLIYRILAQFGAIP